MARTWKDVRETALRTGRIDENKVSEHRREAMATVRAHRLAELRDAGGLNQVTLAKKLGVSQSRVSRIERGDVDHTELSTLRAFVAALGGELEVVVKIGDQRVRIA